MESQSAPVTRMHLESGPSGELCSVALAEAGGHWPNICAADVDRIQDRVGWILRRKTRRREYVPSRRRFISGILESGHHERGSKTDIWMHGLRRDCRFLGITRTIIPIIYQEQMAPGHSTNSGLGDTSAGVGDAVHADAFDSEVTLSLEVPACWRRLQETGGCCFCVVFVR